MQIKLSEARRLDAAILSLLVAMIFASCSAGGADGVDGSAPEAAITKSDIISVLNDASADSDLISVLDAATTDSVPDAPITRPDLAPVWDAATALCPPGPVLNRLAGGARLPVSHRIHALGSELEVELGIAGAFSGIGASLRIRRPGGSYTSNLIESRSGAGAAHQFTLFADIGGTTYVMNQAAGNSAGDQWGYDACLQQSPDGSSLVGGQWLPMYTDEIRPGGVSSPGIPTAPFLTGDSASRQVLVGRPEWSGTPIAAGASGTAIRIRKSWTIRNDAPTTLNMERVIDWDAFYVRTQAAVDDALRVEYAWLDGQNASHDIIVPNQPFGQTPQGQLLANRIYAGPTSAYHYEYNPSFSGWWVIHTNASGNQRLSHLVYTFTSGGVRAGVAVVPPTPGHSTFGYETTVYAAEPGEDPGSLTLFLVFENLPSRSMAAGEEKTFTLDYVVGTLAQLEALGLGTSGDCSGCLGQHASCADACLAAIGTSGYCGFPGSTNPAQCCSCHPAS